MIEGEDYKVVDECMEEESEQGKSEDTAIAQIINAEVTKEEVQNESTKATDSGQDKESVMKDEEANANNDTSEKEAPAAENKCQPGEGSIDFTADISLDHLDTQKEMTDEDVMHHLDEIENIDLDPATFQLQDQSEKKDESEQVVKEEAIKDECEVRMESEVKMECEVSHDKETEKQIESVSTEIKWYEEKLSEKEATIKERLSKLARVLGFSYPCYEKWLERIEKLEGSPMCKLKPARKCPLDKPYTNRWKFICSRKSIQESAKETASADASVNKNIETVWRLEPTGAWGVNTNNESEFPSFVLRAVKIFEDFLQTTEQTGNQEPAGEQNFSDDVSMDMEPKKETINEAKQQWLWLLVRCNSMDELMLFATGKNISRTTMDRLKQVYESGPGKNCNVKSLYCKSVNKCNDTTITNTTFLVGSEALDEIVGGIKIQLAPKTNFWSNAAGAENVSNAVADLLAPTPKTTVLEIGCGIGLIGLMMASKCQQVIGVDSQSEVEEAEMTCELNNIKNATFIMGSPTEVTSKITNAVKNRKTYAIINANTNIGRAIEVMTCLRKIGSLRRIAMVTTLTKQSVRAILELARPQDRNLGQPFIPIQACVVDTLPVGPHFEVVILMERYVMHKITQPWLLKEEEVKEEMNTSQEQTSEQVSVSSPEKAVSAKPPETPAKKNTDKASAKPLGKKGKLGMSAKKISPAKNSENVSVKGKFKGKRSRSPDRAEETPKKFAKKFDKLNYKAWRAEVASRKKKDWINENPQLRINPLYEKQMREHKETDLRERLSNNRIETDIIHKVKEHQVILEMAKEKLSGPAPTVDVTTAKQLQSMLNMVLEQTNKLQSQLPRSVWDRIAPPENVEHSPHRKEIQDDPLLKGRYVQEMGARDILITTSNKKFMNEEEPPKPLYRKYNNIPPLEPNLIVPVCRVEGNREESFQKTTPERYHASEALRKQPTQGAAWNREKMFDKNRWNEPVGNRKPISPMRRQMSPIKHRMSSPRRFSPKRPLLSPPRRPCSPPRRHLSPLRRPMSPFRSRNSPVKRQFSPQRRPMSPVRRPMSPVRRPMSPVRRPISPRRMPPLNSNLNPISPAGRSMTPPRRQISPSMCPVSPTALPATPPRRQLSPPPRRFPEDWDIPSHSAVDQNAWQRANNRMPNNWRDERQQMSASNWEQSNSDRYRKSVSQDKWNVKDSEGTWRGGADAWSIKQPSNPKPNMKEPWPQSSDNRWSNTGPGPSGDNWNMRGKESFSNREEPWTDNNTQQRWESSQQSKESWNQADKDDWNDLPEDARDPWGDDGNLGLKDRWIKFDSAPGPSSGTWVRELEPGDSWSKSKDAWQNKGGPSFSSKPQWQSNSGGSQNTGEPRWMSQNEMGKKSMTGWQSGNNVSPWQMSCFNYNTQRAFTTTQFKEQR